MINKHIILHGLIAKAGMHRIYKVGIWNTDVEVECTLYNKYYHLLQWRQCNTSFNVLLLFTLSVFYCYYHLQYFYLGFPKIP